MIVAVIGGGPAGMMAAAAASGNGHAVTLFEKNEKLGKKLFLTGKGRCNLTNIADADGFFANVVHNPRFLYSALAAFDNRDIMALMEENGVPLKTERGGRVFPVSDHSSDVLAALQRHVHSAGVTVRLNTAVERILAEEDRVTGIETAEGAFPCDAVVIATGGASYPQTGSTGDGYRFAEKLGHGVQTPVPSLVPLVTEEAWPAELMGVSLKNAELSAFRNGKRIFLERGEMLFTHFGVSGPMVLTLSGMIAEAPAGVELSIDYKPALTREQLDARLLRDLADNAKKSVGAALHALLPTRLLAVTLSLADISERLPVGELTRAMRQRLVETLKGTGLHVLGARPLAEAIITRGGIPVREIEASTMASKRVQGLYFAGEVIDVDALTGGYNLQIAYSTGVLAGRSI